MQACGGNDDADQATMLQQVKQDGGGGPSSPWSKPAVAMALTKGSRSEGPNLSPRWVEALALDR